MRPAPWNFRRRILWQTHRMEGPVPCSSREWRFPLRMQQGPARNRLAPTHQPMEAKMSQANSEPKPMASMFTCPLPIRPRFSSRAPNRLSI